jgi:hypothetical protein
VKAHPEAGQTFPEGENWSAAGTGPVNGKTLAHLLGCAECRYGFAQAEKRAATKRGCDCFWCRQRKAHPGNEAHQEFHRISDLLLVAESLRPEDRVQRRACTTCGHVVEIPQESE